jgi:hypothetical protein
MRSVALRVTAVSLALFIMAGEARAASVFSTNRPMLSGRPAAQ